MASVAPNMDIDSHQLAQANPFKDPVNPSRRLLNRRVLYIMLLHLQISFAIKDGVKLLMLLQ